MKRRYSDDCGQQRLCAHLGEQGVYVVLFAVILLGILALCSFALDGSKLARARLWAQRAADAAAISGAGRIALNPNSVAESGGPEPFAQQVAEVALHNLFLRHVVESADSADTVYTRLPGGRGVSAELGEAVVEVQLAAGDKRVETVVRFRSEYILMDIFSPESFHMVTAAAEAEVGAAMVSLMLDTSFSMRLGTKLQDLRNSVSTFLEFFDPQTDRVALIAFGSDAELIEAFNFDLAGGGFNKQELENSLAALQPRGATNHTAALMEAYRQSETLRASQPGWFETSIKGHFIFTDGSTTAATFRFRAPEGALEQNPPGSGIYEYVSVAGNINNEALAPLRLIRSPLPNTALETDQGAAGLAACSEFSGEYSAEQSFGGCVHDLSFFLPGAREAAPRLPIEQFEPAYQMSALAWADFLRVFPLQQNESNSPLGAKLYAIGYGPPVPGGCIDPDAPWDNDSAGGNCADFRKDNFLARLAYDRRNMLRQGREYPPTGIDPEDMSPGLSLSAPEVDQALEDMFKQAAMHFRMKLIR